MKTIKFFPLVLALILTTCTKEELPEPSGNTPVVTFRSEYVPLKGKMTFSSVSRRFDGPVVVERWEGSGNFTHLGRTEVVVHQSIEAGVLSGAIKLTAANGDQLFWSYAGGLTSLDPATLAFTSAITFNVTGGTGRFSGAEGSGTGTGSGTFPNFPPGPGDIVTVESTVKGEISY